MNIQGSNSSRVSFIFHCLASPFLWFANKVVRLVSIVFHCFTAEKTNNISRERIGIDPSITKHDKLNNNRNVIPVNIQPIPAPKKNDIKQQKLPKKLGKSSAPDKPNTTVIPMDIEKDNGTTSPIVIAQNSQKLSQSLNNSRTELPSPKALKKEKKAKDFRELCHYIKKKYPTFNLENFKNIESFQNAGHPFHFAEQKKDMGLMKALVEAGADIFQENSSKDNVLDVLMKKVSFYRNENFGISVPTGIGDTRKKMINYFIERVLMSDDYHIKTESITSLISDCISTDTKWLLSHVIEKVANKENINYIAHAIIENNALDNKKEIIKELIDKKNLDVEATDNLGRSLLYKAISKRNFELAKMLEKDYKADPNRERTSSSKTGPKTAQQLRALIQN